MKYEECSPEICEGLRARQEMDESRKFTKEEDEEEGEMM